MSSHRLAKSVLALTIVVVCAACAATVGGGNPNQPCSPGASFSDQYGKIAIQQAGPGAPIQWGIYPAVPATSYSARVLIDEKQYDKKNQDYPPHGSISSKALHPGAQVEVTGYAIASGGQLNFGLLCRSA